MNTFMLELSSFIKLSLKSWLKIMTSSQICSKHRLLDPCQNIAFDVFDKIGDFIPISVDRAAVHLEF